MNANTTAVAYGRADVKVNDSDTAAVTVTDRLRCALFRIRVGWVSVCWAKLCHARLGQACLG